MDDLQIFMRFFYKIAKKNTETEMFAIHIRFKQMKIVSGLLWRLAIVSIKRQRSEQIVDYKIFHI